MTSLHEFVSRIQDEAYSQALKDLGAALERNHCEVWVPTLDPNGCSVGVLKLTPAVIRALKEGKIPSDSDLRSWLAIQ